MAGDGDPARLLFAILDRAEQQGWRGADPYDALLSRLGRASIPLGPIPRLALSQVVLRSRLARRMIGPSTSINPKGLALFLGAVTRARSVLSPERFSHLSGTLIQALKKSPALAEKSIKGWGYPFPWQSRWFWAPVGTPNAVVTATVGWYLLECADVASVKEARSLGLEAANFLLHRLRFTPQGDGSLALSYTPLDRTRIVNVSMLGARLMARAIRVEEWVPVPGVSTNRAEIADRVDRLVSFVRGSQKENGCWPYAPDIRGRWEDSFHTGFILESLLDLQHLGVDVPKETLIRGFQAYERFFDNDGGARLTPSPDAPYDAHSAAQGILTYAALARADQPWTGATDQAAERSRRIAAWATDQLWLRERGYFAYRIRRGKTDPIEYTRWVQAWMALAMATTATLEAAGAIRPRVGGGAR
jgi:hypothetical protein